MPYSNGRLYVDTSVTPNIGVSIPELQQCFGVVIKSLYQSTTERRLSSDLGVIIGKKKGDTIVDNGVQWQVESRQEINPWARYRPIPCNDPANNTPERITPAQRQAERYGVDPPIDMFAADDIQQYNDYVNVDIVKYGLDYLPLRPFGNDHWKRLSDFSKTNEYGIATSLGYDHNAQPNSIDVTVSGVVYRLSPLIPEHSRTLYIPAGSTTARYHLPNDHIWMDEYYKYIKGQSSRVSNIDDHGHEEWLSPLDLMGQSTYYYNMAFASVRRRIVIYKWMDSQERSEGDQYYDPTDAKWRFYNYATDTKGGTAKDRPFDNNKGAWLDLTDSEEAVNTYYPYNRDPYDPQQAGADYHKMGTLEGRCLFLDCWVEDISSTNVMPICGFAYEVNINRTADVNVDVSGVLTFVAVYEQGDEYSGFDYIVRIDYDPHELEPQSSLVSALSVYYQSLNIRIGEQTVNLLDSSLEYTTNDQGEGDWFRIEISAISGQASTHLGTQAIVSARRVGQSVTATKGITITN